MIAKKSYRLEIERAWRRILIMEDNNSGYYGKTPKLTSKKPIQWKSHITRGFGIFLIIAASILFYFLFLRIDIIGNGVAEIFDILKPFVYGAIIAYFLNPFAKFVEKTVYPILERRVKKGKTARKWAMNISIVSSLVTLLLIVVLLVSLILPELIESITRIIETLPQQVNALIADIESYTFENEELNNFVEEALGGISGFFNTWLYNDLLSDVNEMMADITSGVFNIVGEVFNIVIGLIVSVYVLSNRKLFSSQAKKTVYAILNTKRANLLLHITQKTNHIMGGFIIGKLIDSLIIGTICFVVLSFMGMPYTLLVSVVIGVTNIIPFFGPFIGAIPCGFLILLNDPVQCLYFTIFILILQQVDGNIIGPKILGDSTGLSAFWVLFSILLGGGLFGFAGMIFGVPIFGVIYYIASLFITQKLDAKSLPIATYKYTENSYVDSVTGKFIQSYKDEAKEEKESNNNANTSAK